VAELLLAPLVRVAVVGPVGVRAKSMPVPESETVCVGTGALVVRVKVPAMGPVVVGLKTIT
jgi:hypothetical protein